MLHEGKHGSLHGRPLKIAQNGLPILDGSDVVQCDMKERRKIFLGPLGRDGVYDLIKVEIVKAIGHGDTVVARGSGRIGSPQDAAEVCTSVCVVHGRAPASLEHG
jgi:hypothetical protein